MELKERNYLLDNIKGLLIFLVVFGHSMEMYKDKFPLAKALYIFIYMFHMPVFVFVSGYFSKNVAKARENAVSSLLIPFIIFNIPWSIAALFSANPKHFSFLTPGWALWYLFSMLIWRVFLPDIIRIKNVFIVSIIIGLLAGLFTEFGGLMSLSRTFVFLPYFLAGYFMKKEKLIGLKKYSKLPAIIILIGTIGLAIYIAVSKVMPPEFLWADRAYLHFYQSMWKAISIRAMLYLIGFLFIYVMINLMTSRECFLSKIGKNTLPLYILHTYLVAIILGINKVVPYYYANIAISLVGSALITYLLSRDMVILKFSKVMDKLTAKIMVK